MREESKIFPESDIPPQEIKLRRSVQIEFDPVCERLVMNQEVFVTVNSPEAGQSQMNATWFDCEITIICISIDNPGSFVESALKKWHDLIKHHLKKYVVVVFVLTKIETNSIRRVTEDEIRNLQIFCESNGFLFSKASVFRDGDIIDNLFESAIKCFLRKLSGSC